MILVKEYWIKYQATLVLCPTILLITIQSWHIPNPPELQSSHLGKEECRLSLWALYGSKCL